MDRVSHWQERSRQAPVIVFASEHAQRNKLQAMRDLGAEIHLVPGGYGEAEQAGISYAAATGATWVSPYNDGMVIAGQGTIAMEVISDDLANVSDHLDHSSRWWWSCIRDWMLHSRMYSPLTEIGRSPIRGLSLSCINIYHHGTQKGVDELPSLADGLAGPIEDQLSDYPYRQELCD